MSDVCKRSFSVNIEGFSHTHRETPHLKADGAAQGIAGAVLGKFEFQAASGKIRFQDSYREGVLKVEQAIALISIRLSFYMVS